MSSTKDAGSGCDALAVRYRAVRAATLALCEPFEIEDYVVQAMEDVSPPKWHLAHTTWFFETFVLEPFVAPPGSFRPFDELSGASGRASGSAYRVLFNSYYQSVGQQHARPERGLLSRPTITEIRAYRSSVDEQMLGLLARSNQMRPSDADEIARRVELGIQHEQQHQELLVMDAKYNFSRNPVEPVYRPADRTDPAAHETARPRHDDPMQWIPFDGGIQEFGHVGEGFAFDNETPRHRTLVHPFYMAHRLVTNSEYLAFMADGGYTRPELWLADGWAVVNRHEWRAPLYWRQRDGVFCEFTLRGTRPVVAHEPVAHVSYFEADAYARWAGKRLPSEYEWELAARDLPVTGNFVESGRFHPAPAPVAATSDSRPARPVQVFGDVWEWTQSPYAAYPGYRPLPGALGEYNGKFMCNQFVLRGGSCLTPRSHTRASYRNFFYPHQRWNTQGMRLASDAG